MKLAVNLENLFIAAVLGSSNAIAGYCTFARNIHK